MIPARPIHKRLLLGDPQGADVERRILFGVSTLVRLPAPLLRALMAQIIGAVRAEICARVGESGAIVAVGRWVGYMMVGHMDEVKA